MIAVNKPRHTATRWEVRLVTSTRSFPARTSTSRVSIQLTTVAPHARLNDPPQLPDAPLHGEATLNSSPCCFTQASSKRRILGEPQHAVRHPIDIVLVHEQARLTLDHHIRNPAVTGCYDREPCGARLDDRHWSAFAISGRCLHGMLDEAP